MDEFLYSSKADKRLGKSGIILGESDIYLSEIKAEVEATVSSSSANLIFSFEDTEGQLQFKSGLVTGRPFQNSLSRNILIKKEDYIVEGTISSVAQTSSHIVVSVPINSLRKKHDWDVNHGIERGDVLNIRLLTAGQNEYGSFFGYAEGISQNKEVEEVTFEVGRPSTELRKDLLSKKLTLSFQSRTPTQADIFQIFNSATEIGKNTVKKYRVYEEKTYSEAIQNRRFQVTLVTKDVKGRLVINTYMKVGLRGSGSLQEIENYYGYQFENVVYVDEFIGDDLQVMHFLQVK